MFILACGLSSFSSSALGFRRQTSSCSARVSLLLHSVLADVGAGLVSSGIWSSHLDTTVDWASYVFGFILHRLTAMFVDVLELGT
jgi:hypothetical protein